MTSLRILIAPLAVLLALLAGSVAATAETVVRDGNTLQLAGVTYRLDGIEAPDFDQICVNSYADPWACGVEARDQLAKLIDRREVSCQDLGPDKTSGKRRAGLCIVAGETASLNQLLVRAGLALSAADAKDSVKDSIKAEEAEAKNKHRGLWSGCFMAPQDFRRWNLKAALLGASCRADKDAELRTVLLPKNPAAPPGCTIKGTFAARAKMTGNVGVYHIQACRNYASVTRQSRWFCSEEDAQAAGFRRAYNCRAKRQ